MSNILVAYFSASGVTAQVAQKLASVTGADLFTIEPETPYTDKDLDWHDKKSRSSLEMDNPNCRPAIRSTVTDMSRYSVIFVGFPVWWYREPSIIDTFMKAYDFSGKTVIPFATSGSSPIGNSGKNMQALAPKANVAEGKRFSAGAADQTLADWASEWTK